MRDGLRVRGRGVHGGRACTVALHPRPGPVRLRRAGREVAPHVRQVVATRGCTVLGTDGARLAMVEHLLAALHIRGVWSGLLIEVDADELPILDGSAAPWDEALSELGPFPEPPPPAALRGEAADDAGACARLRPGRRSVAYRIAYDHPALRDQSWSGGPERWRDVLPARTFGFARDAAALRAAGLAAGVSDENAIVFGEEGPSTPLRFPDEPVRHKVLDALGDLYLLGRPFAGALEIDRGGHALHHALMTQILADPSTTNRIG